MNLWVLVQIFLNFIFLSVIALLWLKLNRPQKDDPRLSRGLQILQSKISVLEDLSDRTEDQVRQLTDLIEEKCQNLRQLIAEADEHVALVEKSMGQSLEAAKVIQDTIPHQEILERQNTIKYVRAAQLAHAGASVDEIAQNVDLTRGELEFIAKVNRDQLQFSMDTLPVWIKEELKNFPTIEIKNPKRDVASLSQLGDRFRKAFAGADDFVASSPAQQQAPLAPQPRPQVVPQPPAPSQQQQRAVAQPPPTPARAAATQAKASGPTIKKVVFPRIDMTNNLG